MLTAIDFSVQPVLQANFEKKDKKKINRKSSKFLFPSVQIYSNITFKNVSDSSSLPYSASFPTNYIMCALCLLSCLCPLKISCPICGRNL